MAVIDPFDRMIVRGEGTMLFDDRGKRFFDATSSIWTTVHGHCHPSIVDRICNQARTLDHSTLLGLCNDVAEKLADRLTRLTSLSRVFYSGDGASAIEVALKIALQYWQNVGVPERRHFIKLTGAYHGDTTGAMSVSDIAPFKERFKDVTFASATYDDSSAQLEASDVAGVIVEPIVQAAAGIRLIPNEAYDKLRTRSTLLIVDEIATGFGRTGSMFAFEKLGLQPDILCIGKGLTGGTLPLSATLVVEQIYEAFLGDFSEMKHLLHGHSYAGNPIACAAALASLDLFAVDDTLHHVSNLSNHLDKSLEAFRRHPLIRDVRQAGLMCGIELDGNQIDRGQAPTPAWKITSYLYDHGILTRPIGDVVQLVPPLTSRPADIDLFCTRLTEALSV